MLPKRCQKPFSELKNPLFTGFFSVFDFIPTRPFQTSLKQIRLWELAHVIQIASIIQMVWAI